MDDDDGAPLKITQAISLPLLIKDWVLKEYPDKCCYSMREYHDVELNLITHDQVNTVSSLVISPNSKLTSAPNCAYLITVTKESVRALHYFTLPMPIGRGTAAERTQYADEILDWKAPNFFTLLAKEIGCQCKNILPSH